MKKVKRTKNPVVQPSDLRHLTTYYSSKKKEKNSYAIVGWENLEAQETRFSVLPRVVDIRKLELLDVGCGVASLRQYLQAQKLPVASYTGIDLFPHMIELAGKRFPKDTWVHGDILRTNLWGEKSFDVIFSSGMFNLRLSDNLAYLNAALEKFCWLARKMVVCTMLSDSSPDPEKEYYYYSAHEVEVLARLHAPKIQLIADYLLNDMALVVELDT